MPSTPLTRVLCVDDNADSGEMLGLLLRPFGVEVTCSQSAAEARLRIESQTFNLFMLEAWLPELDGFELCRQLRESDAITPILFYSGAAYEADIKKGMAAGANAYVTKPNVDGLLETVQVLVAGSRAVNIPLWAGENCVAA